MAEDRHEAREARDGSDPGDALAGAAVASLLSTAAVRASTDAVELQAIATLAQVRRTQALTAARREAERLLAMEGGVDRDRIGRRRRPRPVDLDLVDRCTAQEVSVALWLSPVVARDRLELALELLERRPATFEALREGRIDVVRARRITDAVRGLSGRRARWAAGPDAAVEGGDDAGDPDGVAPAEPATPDLASLVEAEVLCPGRVPELAARCPGRAAGELTPAQLTARLARLVLRADPAGATERTRTADARRGCTLRPLPDGMAVLSVTGRGELLTAAWARIDSIARTLVDKERGATAAAASVAGEVSGLATDTTPDGANRGPVVGRDAARGLEQTRVDVLLAALLGHSDDLAQVQGVGVELALVAPAATVLEGGDEPGELAGYGPVPAPLVRELASDAVWRRWSSDPATGRVTDVGRRRYRPNAAVADLVRARDRECRFPTCRRRVEACDLDHVVPFPAGATDASNLAVECRLHHLCKHRGGFRMLMDPDGTIRWTTPTGQVVVDHPPDWGRPPPQDRDNGSAEPAVDDLSQDPPPF